MGRCRGNPLTPKRQVGAVYPDPTAEPVDQGRDSSLGLLIASGIFDRLVPGSPAAPYLGCDRRARNAFAFQLVGAFLQQPGKAFECRGEVGIVE